MKTFTFSNIIKIHTQTKIDINRMIQSKIKNKFENQKIMKPYPPALNYAGQAFAQSYAGCHPLSSSLPNQFKGGCGQKACPVAGRGRVAVGWRAPAVVRLVVGGGDDQRGDGRTGALVRRHGRRLGEEERPEGSGRMGGSEVKMAELGGKIGIAIFMVRPSLAVSTRKVNRLGSADS